MSQYLSNIAGRSAGKNSMELMPAIPVYYGSESAIDQDLSEENILQDSSLQNQNVPQGILPVQPAAIQMVQQAFVLNNTEIKEPVKNIEPTYFSKHIERVEGEVENSPVKNNRPAAIKYNVEEPFQQSVQEHKEVRLYENEPGFISKKVSKIIPEIKGAENKKEFKTGDEITEAVQENETIPVFKPRINPLVKDKVQNKNLLKAGNSRIQRITPANKDKQPAGPVHRNHPNLPAPKLVIGKISVEILPPKLPVPQKVITRVVPSSSNDSHSKSNKLIFGLRQL
jgi:hypothetical protein